MKFENTEVWGFKHALRGMRNPMNSWDKSDSDFSDECHSQSTEACEDCEYFDGFNVPCLPKIGKNDMALAQKLIRAGSEHRKFLRQIFVSVDITAPLYWMAEFDTYKVGTVANSTSKMHKILSSPITEDNFEMDDATDFDKHIMEKIVDMCESIRQRQFAIDPSKGNPKKYWKALIRVLPESWLQTRTITMNYENLLSICKQRRNHKLNEWSGKDDPTKPNFIAWARSLPYAKEFIFLDEEQETE